MTEILHILRYKILSFIKVNIDWHFESAVKNVGSFLVYTGFSIGTFFFTRGLIAFLLEEVHIGQFLLHRFISMLLYVFFLSVNVGNIIVSYSTLYKSKEVVYLLTAPVSHTNLFVIKFLDNFFYSSTTLFLIGLCALLGYGSYFQHSWTFYVWAMMLLFIPFMLLAAAVGVIMLMGLMKIAGRIGARKVIIGLGSAYVLSIYAFFRFTNPMKLVNEVMKYYPNLNQYFGYLDPPFSRFLPNHWAAEVLYWTGMHNGTMALPYLYVLLGLCALSCVGAVLLARRWYYPTWLASLDLRARRAATSEGGGIFSMAKNSMLGHQTEVLFKKEFWQFFRDPSQYIHLSVMALLMAIFVGSMMQLRTIQVNPLLQTISYLVIFLFNAFLIASISVRFVYPLISIEGESFWKIRSAPISLHKVAGLKFALAWSATFVIGQLLNALSSRPLGLASILWLSSASNTAFITLAMVGLSFGGGSFFATYHENNPIRVASSQGASLTFLLSLLYLVFLVSVLFIPVNRYFESVFTGASLATSGIVTGVVTVGSVSFIIAGLSYVLSIRSLKRDF